MAPRTLRSENAPRLAHELVNVLNHIRAFSAVPDERIETFAGPSTGFARAKVSSAKTVRLGHAAVELSIVK